MVSFHKVLVFILRRQCKLSKALGNIKLRGKTSSTHLNINLLSWRVRNECNYYKIDLKKITPISYRENFYEQNLILWFQLNLSIL